jgi:tripartite-type tricarboxylate transporter receptor subunit TctC
MAVTSATRNSRIPDVPTVAESGLAGYDVSSWYGVCTQAAVPKPILSKLQADVTKALRLPMTAKRLTEQGLDVRVTTPEEFVAHVRAETQRWTKVVREANIPMQ